MFDALKGAEIRLFDPSIGNGMVATYTIAPAAILGHSGVKFFGCDSSVGMTTHAYTHEPGTLGFAIVECGGEVYLTDPGLLIQAELLCKMKQECPRFIEETGDGFLGALIRNGGKYEVTGVTRTLYEQLEVRPSVKVDHGNPLHTVPGVGGVP